MIKSRHILIVSVSILLVGCAKAGLPDGEPGGIITLGVAEGDAELSVATKADAVTSMSSFYASATTGTTSQSSVFTSTSFTDPDADGKYTGGKVWPASSVTYNFYGSNVPLTFNSAGTTVSASNGTDVICAYSEGATYNAVCPMTFNHIFARLANVTVSANTGYTISGVSFTITPKTGGTYNLRTGEWSGVTTGSATSIANATPGTKSNDIYLVPGTYTVTMSWTAVKDVYSKTVTDHTKDVTLTAGKRNNISVVLSGDAADIQMGVTVTGWDSEPVAMGLIKPVPPVYSFDGYRFAPGNLYYDGSTYKIAADWNHESYNSVYSLNAGSYYFSWLEVGKRFDSRGNSFGNYSGDINNGNPIDGWTVPTAAIFGRMVGITGSREGSTVNGTTGRKYAWLQLTGVTFAGSSTPGGLLVFPDGLTITGKTLSYTNASGATSGVTLSELQNYLDQGCAFLPAGGQYYSGSWGSGGASARYWFTDRMDSSKSLATNYFVNGISNLDQFNTNYFMVRLVKPLE